MIATIAATIVGISILVSSAGLLAACVIAAKTREECEDELGEVSLSFTETELLSSLRYPAQTPVPAYSSTAALTPMPKR